MPQILIQFWQQILFLPGKLHLLQFMSILITIDYNSMFDFIHLITVYLNLTIFLSI